MKKRQGFTLAEVLVVLVVLGVLASILIPTLLAQRPNQEMVMLKKAYYLTSRTVNELINDDEFYPYENLGFEDTDTAIYHNETYELGKKFCGLFASRLNLRDNTMDCKEDGSGHFITADGMDWTLTKDGSTNVRTFTIDVNGNNSGANCLEKDCKGKNPDRFEISFDQWGVIKVPKDGIEQKYLSTNNTTKKYQELKKK